MYKPLGSGTYDEHLCAFPIENDRVYPLHFRFAADVAEYATPKKKFLDLIRRSSGH